MCRQLNSSGLAGPVSWVSLAQLPNLQVLNLFNNSLTGQLSNPLPPALTFLSLSKNQISGSIPEDLALPATLSELWVAYNELEGSIPSGLKVSLG